MTRSAAIGHSSRRIRAPARLSWEFPRVRLAALVPHLAGLRVRHVTIEATRLTVAVESTRRTAPCPLCRRRSTRVHSRYVRTLADLPWAERAVRLRLTVRRFRC